MKKALLSLLAFVLIIAAVILVLPVRRMFPGLFTEGRLILVLYDEPSPRTVNQDRLNALMLRQLLGHFQSHQIDLVSTGEYKRGQIKDYDIAFYVGTKQDLPLPSYLLDDIFYFKGTMVWIGANLDQAARRHSMDGYGFTLVDEDDNHPTNRVQYKNRSLWKLDTRTYEVKITNEQKNRVLAWATTAVGEPQPAGRQEYGPHPGLAVTATPEHTPAPSALPPLPEQLTFGVTPEPPPVTPQFPVVQSAANKMPWIVRADRFWYIASDPFSFNVEGGAYLAFCDILHDVVESGVSEDHPALVRLEDVHAKRNPADLIAAADFLHQQEIPFAFTLIPVYKNPATNETIYLSNDPQFKQTVRALIARGGIPVLHGYSHQHVAETAVDYEFWDGPNGGPISTGPEFAAERVLRGLSECFLSEIYPVAFTTPHYAASQTDYLAIRNYFTTVLERRQPIDQLGTDQFFPYVIYRDMNKQIIMPEDLGYVQPLAGRDVAALLKDAENTKVVRDGWASFFFHSYLDLQLLKDLVAGLKKQGYHFVSLADYNNKVRTDDTVVISGVGQVDLNLKSQYFHEFSVRPDGRPADETYSYRPITGIIEKYATTHKGEVRVYQGVYNSPPFTLSNVTKFRPVISGITSPISIFLLFVGMMIMITFLVIWVFLLVRKTTTEIKGRLSQRRGQVD